VSNIDPSQEGDQIDIKEYRQAMERLAAKEKETADLNKALQLKDVEFAAQIAGIPTGTGAGKAFVDQYDGKLDADSIKEAAIQYGIYREEGANPGGKPADQAQVEADRLALQNAGAVPDVGEQPPSEHPGKVGLAEFDRRVKQEGIRREDAVAEVFDRLVDAAVKGDTRVLVQNPAKQ
jgi:hypothetical protein